VYVNISSNNYVTTGIAHRTGPALSLPVRPVSFGTQCFYSADEGFIKFCPRFRKFSIYDLINGPTQTLTLAAFFKFKIQKYQETETANQCSQQRTAYHPYATNSLLHQGMNFQNNLVPGSYWARAEGSSRHIATVIVCLADSINSRLIRAKSSTNWVPRDALQRA
jgi:hypothetical protein